MRRTYNFTFHFRKHSMQIYGEFCCLSLRFNEQQGFVTSFCCMCFNRTQFLNIFKKLYKAILGSDATFNVDGSIFFDI